MLLNVLNFLKALWQRAAQYINILGRLKNSDKFWKQLSNCILLTSVDSSSSNRLTETEALNLAYRYQCQSSILEITAYDMFLRKKLLQVESLEKQEPDSRGTVENSVNADKPKAANLYNHRDILSTWCQSSVLVNLIKSLTSYDYDNKSFYHAQVTVEFFFAFHLMILLNM